MSVYSHEERAHRRGVVRRLEKMATSIRQSLEQAKTPDPAVVEAAIKATGASEPSAQVDALTKLADLVRGDHLSKLKPLAKADFSAFCEYVNPTEPPESRWHIWLTAKLQEIEYDPTLNHFILNCPPGHAKPLHVDTLVTMGNGELKRLGDIKVGELVLTHKARPRKVLAVHEQGRQPLVRITTQLGREVLAEPTHAFLVESKQGYDWRKAAGLSPADWLVSVDNIAQADTSGASIEMFRLAGFVAATGSVGTQASRPDRRQLRLYCSDEARTRQAQADAEALGLKLSVYPHRQANGFAINVPAKTRDALGGLIDIDAKAADRQAPEFVFRGSPEKIKAFLDTFIAIRGEFQKGRVGPNLSVFAKSDMLLLDLQALLLKLGVPAAVERPGAGFAGRPWLYLDARNCMRWLARGGSVSVRSQDDFDARVAAENDQDNDGDNYDFGDKVFAVEPGGRGECRCLTVEEDASFVANGLAVHNSTYASRLYVGWRLGRDPDQRILGGGHGQTFVENEFSKKIRDLIGTPEYQGVFPDVKINHKSSAVGQWGIAHRKGQYVARGVGQGVHGFRATFICIDDPYAKIDDARSPAIRRRVENWIDIDMQSRALPECKFFVIMTRFHEEDLTQHLLDMNPELPEEDKWTCIVAPALCIDPDTDILGRHIGEVLWPFYKVNYFAGKRVSAGFIQFALTYQQLTSAADPNNIASSFQYYSELPHQTAEAREKALLDSAGRPMVRKADHIFRTIVSVDCASKKTERADYTVVQVWMQDYANRHFLAHQERKKVEYDDMIGLIERTASNWGADMILVEDKGQGIAYIQNRGGGDGKPRLAPAPVVPINPGQQAKEFRFDAVRPMISVDHAVYLPEKAPWLDGYIAEIGQFPDAAHDDQVDATSQYLSWARENSGRKFGSKKATSMG